MELFFSEETESEWRSIPCLYVRNGAYNIGFTKKNAEISGTRSLGTKIDMRLLFTAFYS